MRSCSEVGILEVVKLYPEIGEAFEGRYRIEDLVGVGGFARIYRATQTDLGRTVAIKVLTFSEYDNGPVYGEVLEERFQREASLVSLLNDPNTITMFDFGKSETGLLYIVMEYVDGVTLADLLPTVGRMDVERTFRILAKIAQSLREAHERNVIHGDIKPNNIMVYEHLDQKDCVKVLDFGIAHVAQTTDFNPAEEPGTPWYMAPEQILGEAHTTRSDLYSLGLVVYELLTGSRAVAGDDVISAISAQLSPAPFEVPPEIGLDNGANEIVLKLLQKEPDARYESAKALADDIASWLNSDAAFDRKETNVFRRVAPLQKSTEFSRASSKILLHGRYEPIATVDQNEFGSRLKARDTFIDRTVVLHVVPPKLDDQQKQSFVERAKLLVASPHPNLPLIHDIAAGDAPMLVCEFIGGEPLSSVIGESPMSNVQSKEIAIQIAYALQVIHDQGMWHGDVNTAGIASISGHVKFQNFGACFTGNATSPRLVDAAQKTDIFSFGALLAELLIGAPVPQGTLPNFPESASKTLVRLARECTGVPDSRPNIVGVVEALNSGRESIINF